ncbi:MAG: hypothetical protein HP492_07975, partial [Nitrospira sp.]|nr:hypothetical protein [Nitrospira sp.]
VVNGLSDYNHPCQGMADALTIQEKFGRAKGLNVTYVGDGNNVAVSLMHVCAKLGWNFTIANPEDYDITPKAVAPLIARGGFGLAFQDDRAAVVRHGIHDNRTNGGDFIDGSGNHPCGP